MLPRRDSLTSETSALAPVTTMPPPRPSSVSATSTRVKSRPAKGSSQKEIEISVRPPTSAIFLPLRSINGPTEMDATTSPMACAVAMVPACASVNPSVGLNVPQVAATMP